MPWLFDLSMQRSLAKGWITWDRGCRGTWKVSDCTEGVIGLLEGLSGRDGEAMDIFVSVIHIARWNQMHIGSVPCNNESITVC